MHRSVRRRSLAAAAAVVAAILTLSACGSSSDEGSKPSSGFTPGELNRDYAGTTISVLMPPWAQMPKEQVAKFTEETGIEVDLQSLDFEAIHDKIVTSGASNIAPADVVEVDSSWVGQFGAAKWFASLDQWLPQETLDDALGVTGFAFDGNQVAIPYVLDFRGSLVDMTVLKKAGITTPPQTFEELLDAAKAVKSAGILEHPIAMPLSVGEGTATPWFAMLRSSGVAVLDDQGKAAFDEPASRASLDLIHELYSGGLIDQGAVSMTDVQVSDQLIATGKTAISLSASPASLVRYLADGSALADHELRFSHVPGMDNADGPSIGLQEGLGIPEASKNKEAAAQFVYWWMQQEQLIAMYQKPDYGILPANKATLQALTDQDKLVGGEDIMALADNIEPVFSAGPPTWYPKFSSQVATQIRSVALGKTKSDAAVKALLDSVESNSK